MRLSNVAFTGSINISGSLVLPNGTANLRPSNAQTGSLFVETSSSGSNLLVYNGQSGSGWEIAGIQTEPKLYIPPPSGDIEYLVVAGGGGAAKGGGGAGGYLSSSLSSIPSGSTITITVGAGGTGIVSDTSAGNTANQGGSSSLASSEFSTVAAIGGGGGAIAYYGVGGDGGSGGGGAGLDATGDGDGGSGTAGQGFDGGTGKYTTNYGGLYAMGGGGGASEVGSDAQNTTVNGSAKNGGDGGDGKQSKITGTATYYAGGGGGGVHGDSTGYVTGDGGQGGGADAADQPGSNGQNAGNAGTANTGGGGGGAASLVSYSGQTGGQGGSGIVVLAYDSGSITATGGVAKSRSDGHVYHTFNSSGTLTVGGPDDPSVLNGDNFGAITYVGDRPTNAAKTGMGFKADLIIIKGRSFSDHWSVLDSSRGANVLGTNSTDAQASFSGFTFDTDGFTVGSSGQANSNGETHIAWGWKATGGTTTSNGVGSITSAVQANTAAGFSIVTYTGNGTSGATVGHGLSQTPDMVIAKGIDGSNSSWWVHHVGLSSGYQLELNNSSAQTNYSSVFNGTAPTSTVVTLGNGDPNRNGNTQLLYCFHSVSGYSKFGSYSGTGSSLEITVGFSPRFVMIKRYASSGDRWLVVDSFRGGATNNDSFLDFQDTLSERDMNATNGLTFNANSFTINTTDGALNNSAGSYIYWAIA